MTGASPDKPRLGATPRLAGVAERRQVRLAGVTFDGWRRRPSGEKPPLARPLQAAGWLWLLAALFVLLSWISLIVWPETVRWWYQREHEVVQALAEMRTDVLDGAAAVVAFLASMWVVRPLRIATLAALIVVRKWYRMAVAVGILLVVQWAMTLLALGFGRERPLGVDIITAWAGPSHPSLPVASLTVTLAVMLMVLAPAGPWRRRGAVVAIVVIAAVALARLYQGVDHPSDALFGALLAGAAGVVGFRLIAPDAAFPVAPRRGRSAHLDVGEERSAAIRRAMQEQQGMTVEQIEPYGLEGSAGSTPLRLEVSGPAGKTAVFGKLYSGNHLRSDRMYKAARSILYGTLEDEVSFKSVGRLVEREDYMLRVMRDAEVPTPTPLGFAEVAPQREYLIVTEFLDGAVTIRNAPLDQQLARDALRVVRRMWDVPLAHRDIKPSNVMVRQGTVVLVDVAFSTARPTPWRQAVDLANMMLILGLRMSPEQVYDIALEEFAADDIAEAFAATHGVTIPAELRSELKTHRRTTGVDLVAEFFRLAPDREVIHVQRWSWRRIGLAVGGALLMAAFVFLVVQNIRWAGLL
jgi:tRNA A-37 threonylcarbamoyl transferase component Bud32